MTLHYTISDTELAKLTLPRKAKLTSNTAVHRYSIPKKIGLLALAIANVILWAFVYEVWPGKEPPVADFSQTSFGSVTGIMYSEDKPSAIIHGKSVHEGDVVNGYKIKEIGRSTVVFEKDGRIISKQVSVNRSK